MRQDFRFQIPNLRFEIPESSVGSEHFPNKEPIMLRFFQLTIVAAALTALAASGLRAADHRDAPNLAVEVGGAAARSLDINDVYIFQSPANANNTVMMMTVNPLVVPGEVVFFSSVGTYEFKINNGGDVNPELTFQCKFTAPRSGRQEIRVTRIDHLTNKSDLIARGQTGSTIQVRDGGELRADTFDDPFFFDLDAFKGTNGRNFNDANVHDFFAGFNTQIIVLEMPSSKLTGVAGNNISVWCRTLDANGAQFDRMGRPAINTVLVRPNRFYNPGGNNKKAFNETHVNNDTAMWGAEVKAALMAFGNTAAQADGLTSVLLPDVLTFDVSNSGGFLNGRRLPDDVIDAELGLIVKPAGALTTDSVFFNDKIFRARFPYAAVPH